MTRIVDSLGKSDKSFLTVLSVNFEQRFPKRLMNPGKPWDAKYTLCQETLEIFL